MIESQAWLDQVDSDFLTAEILSGSEQPVADYCQIIAKYQQTVEKAVKAIDAALRDSGEPVGKRNTKHNPKDLFRKLVRIPTRRGYKDVPKLITKELATPQLGSDINDLCLLAPKLPEPGHLYARNTEYPYNLSGTHDWTSPSDVSSFTDAELERFRKTAQIMRQKAHRISSIVSRKP
jgi:hypothetical protein